MPNGAKNEIVIAICGAETENFEQHMKYCPECKGIMKDRYGSNQSSGLSLFDQFAFTPTKGAMSFIFLIFGFIIMLIGWFLGLKLCSDLMSWMGFPSVPTLANRVVVRGPEAVSVSFVLSFLVSYIDVLEEQHLLAVGVGPYAAMQNAINLRVIPAIATREQFFAHIDSMCKVRPEVRANNGNKICEEIRGLAWLGV